MLHAYLRPESLSPITPRLLVQPHSSHYHHTKARAHACACADDTPAPCQQLLAMAVSMLHAPSRASTSSSSSFIPVSRQNTMSSHDGSRSVRQSKRYSVTALYLSMSAKDKDLEIEDELARGTIGSNFLPSPRY